MAKVSEYDLIQMIKELEEGRQEKCLRYLVGCMLKMNGYSEYYDHYDDYGCITVNLKPEENEDEQ